MTYRLRVPVVCQVAGGTGLYRAVLVQGRGRANLSLQHSYSIAHCPGAVWNTKPAVFKAGHSTKSAMSCEPS